MNHLEPSHLQGLFWLEVNCQCFLLGGSLEKRLVQTKVVCLCWDKRHVLGGEALGKQDVAWFLSPVPVMHVKLSCGHSELLFWRLDSSPAEGKLLPHLKKRESPLCEHQFLRLV